MLIVNRRNIGKPSWKNSTLAWTKYIEDGNAVNIGTSEYVSLNRIMEKIFNIMQWQPPEGVKYQIEKPVGVLHRALDGEFALKKTGWWPKTRLEDGLQKTIDWYINTHSVE